MLRTGYDPEANAMFVWFAADGVKSAETEEVAPGIMLDFDDKGEVIGVEILYVSRRMAKPQAAAPGRPSIGDERNTTFTDYSTAPLHTSAEFLQSILIPAFPYQRLASVQFRITPQPHS